MHTILNVQKIRLVYSTMQVLTHICKGIEWIFYFIPEHASGCESLFFQMRMSGVLNPQLERCCCLTPVVCLPHRWPPLLFATLNTVSNVATSMGQQLSLPSVKLVFFL